MKTKAAVLRNVGGPLIIEELEVPQLARGQVLVKIFCSGLCRSQINEINGRKGKEFIPHLLGHEASGEVVETGAGVTKVKSGDYVVASWIKGLGLDSPIVKYGSKNGVVNAGAVATFSEYAVISENRLTKIPKEIKPIPAALLGCAIPTGAGIIDRLGDLHQKKIIIFGIGGIGASALIRALALGAQCTAVDIKQWKSEWARNLGAFATLPPDSIFYPEKTLSNGFDYAIECSGNKEAMEMAFNCLKNNGTAIIAGNLKPGEKISIDPFELVKGKKLRGTWGGECFLDEDIPFYVSEYLKGDFPIEKLVTKTYSFDEINEGLKDLEDGKLIRGIVEI